jgi:hypothetical protein
MTTAYFNVKARAAWTLASPARRMKLSKPTKVKPVMALPSVKV